MYCSQYQTDVLNSPVFCVVSSSGSC
jgi:hypothetical protein